MGFYKFYFFRESNDLFPWRAERILDHRPFAVLVAMVVQSSSVWLAVYYFKCPRCLSKTFKLVLKSLGVHATMCPLFKKFSPP